MRKWLLICALSVYVLHSKTNTNNVHVSQMCWYAQTNVCIHIQKPLHNKLLEAKKWLNFVFINLFTLILYAWHILLFQFWRVYNLFFTWKLAFLWNAIAVVDLREGPGLPLILGEKGEMAEGRKASKVPYGPLAQGLKLPLLSVWYSTIVKRIHVTAYLQLCA